MSGLEYFFIIFLIALVLGLLIFFIILRFKLQGDEGNNDIVWNFASNKTNKRSTGTVKDIVSGRGRRSLVIYTVRDSNDDKVEDVPILVDKILDLPKGTLSKDRGIKILLPRNPEDLDPSVRDTPLGTLLNDWIEKKNTTNNVIDTLRESRERQDTLNLIQGGGELSKDEINRKNELMQELSRLIVKGAEKKPGEP